MNRDFITEQAPHEDYWRSIILFGRNVASYKFSLAQALLKLRPNQDEIITLDKLALPFALEICRHLVHADRQSTSNTSTFLDACRATNAGQISHEALREQTVRLGFNDVLDAFHVVDRSLVPLRFFSQEKLGRSRGIRVTREFMLLSSGSQLINLSHEVEARWSLVETAWSLGCSPKVLQVRHEPVSDFLTVDYGRKCVAGVRPALNGYQKGQCFYCFRNIAVDGPNVADVDHFFPVVLKPLLAPVNIDGIWNLVLSCRECNRGFGGKLHQLPHRSLLARLNLRNEFLIDSHHPLRNTLIAQTGASKQQRRKFLTDLYGITQELLPGGWQPASVAPPMF